MTQLTPPRILKIDILSIEPIDRYGQYPYPDQPWTFRAELLIEPQLHSDLRTPRPGYYNGLDVVSGDYISTQSSKILKITEINIQSASSVKCVLEDEHRLNSSVDENQMGESVIETGNGILFTAPYGMPILYPLQGQLSGISTQDLVEIMSRFFYTNGAGYTGIGPTGPAGDILRFTVAGTPATVTRVTVSIQVQTNA